MGFSFRGIFTHTKDKAVIEAAKRQWPFCTIYNIRDPFDGIAIYRKAETNSKLFLQEYDEKDKIEKELPEFSSLFPETIFIHLRTDCHGGDCTYDGFGCRHGKILLDNRGKSPEKINNHIETEKLRELVQLFDANIGSHFAPFERGFFDNEDNIIS